ncbi:hypothetical protein CK203_027773 [Vitis vinifera]|uniref:Uncharacterized protein n=1 Tax=Vitis vinifera TaxID=29760 RepID=A0A438J3X6_VITVI|nr:hypothetical protein CK203_027773 [Vitis vinifera]
MEFGAREVALRLFRLCWRARWNWQGIGEGTGVGTGEGSGDCSVKSMGSELSTLGLFCSGRPLTWLSCGLKERKTCPSVRAISGCRNLAGMDEEDDRRLPVRLKEGDEHKTPFSQPLRNAFRSCEIECHCAAKWHTCAKIAFAIAKYPAEWDFCCEIRALPSQRFAAAKWGSCAAKWHSCAKLAFAAAKILAENSKVLRNGLATKCSFRRSFL